MANGGQVERFVVVSACGEHWAIVQSRCLGLTGTDIHNNIHTYIHIYKWGTTTHHDYLPHISVQQSSSSVRCNINTPDINWLHNNMTPCYACSPRECVHILVSWHSCESVFATLLCLPNSVGASSCPSVNFGILATHH